MEDASLNKTYEIKLPTSSWVALTLQLPVISMIFFSAVTGKGLYSAISPMIGTLFSLFYTGALIAIVIRMIIQPRYVKIIGNKIIVGHKEIPAVQIDKLVIQGYFSRIIGIKPKGKRLVPSLLCFKIKGNEEEDTEEVVRWAKRNGIQIKYGRIIRWI
ncbi:hypothetical protein J41TS12_12100 [Paenibacillus antibioticophila]|uniref:Uncharacterized protein n=1 Tax=Paenibacillus antibioticophila TaxID=1274374 RepID=A0A919XP35_9BACL|nr:hypothetical protein [Paenibacillus antibioticophila]GIO36349.1 hypothetical protein J41TS12_12100 [Paenibacillus antibioticophila]